tara:strand:+ start:1515 stop:2123 length:609 start_codon:yes stop_codon:yes gene_type:complete
MNEFLFALPIIGALIGWLTNWVAVKMLFHPRKPLRLGIATVQGIFPKRQRALAEKLGVIVSTELFSMQEVTAKLQQKVESKEVVDKIRDGIRHAIEKFMENGVFTSMANLFVTDEMKWDIANQMAESFRPHLRQLAKDVAHNIETEIDVEAIVREKVINFSSDKLEEILFAIMKREFRFVELVGAVLGFLIGSVQLAITWPY